MPPSESAETEEAALSNASDEAPQSAEKPKGVISIRETELGDAWIPPASMKLLESHEGVGDTLREWVLAAEPDRLVGRIAAIDHTSGDVVIEYVGNLDGIDPGVMYVTQPKLYKENGIVGYGMPTSTREYSDTIAVDRKGRQNAREAQVGQAVVYEVVHPKPDTYLNRKYGSNAIRYWSQDEEFLELN